MKRFKFYGIILLGVIFSFMSTSGNATKGDEKSTGTELKYIGLLNNQPAFQLILINQQKESLEISVKDWHNDVLYSKKTKEGNTSIIFQLDTYDLANSNLRVVVMNPKTRKSEVFTINMDARTVLSASVSKK